MLYLIPVILSHINDINTLKFSLIWINGSKFSSCQNMVVLAYIGDIVIF